MSPEETIRESLAQRLGIAPGRVAIARARRMTLELTGAEFRGVLECAAAEMGFARLCAITGLDEGANLACIHHLARADGIVLGLKTRAPKSDPCFPSVTGLFPGAAIYERELVDLFGARISGLPEGARYPLPDGWPAGCHPLRKDFSPAAPDGGRRKEAEGHA